MMRAVLPWIWLKLYGIGPLKRAVLSHQER